MATRGRTPAQIVRQPPYGRTLCDNISGGSPIFDFQPVAEDAQSGFRCELRRMTLCNGFLVDASNSGTYDIPVPFDGVEPDW